MIALLTGGSQGYAKGRQQRTENEQMDRQLGQADRGLDLQAQGLDLKQREFDINSILSIGDPELRTAVWGIFGEEGLTPRQMAEKFGKLDFSEDPGLQDMLIEKVSSAAYRPPTVLGKYGAQDTYSGTHVGGARLGDATEPGASSFDDYRKQAKYYVEVLGMDPMAADLKARQEFGLVKDPPPPPPEDPNTPPVDPAPDGTVWRYIPDRGQWAPVPLGLLGAGYGLPVGKSGKTLGDVGRQTLEATKRGFGF